MNKSTDPVWLALAGRFADKLSGQSGWRRGAAALLAGALSVLALAPFHISPVLFITLPVLFWLSINGQSPNQKAAILHAAAAGWWFGFGFHLAGLYWIGSAFLVEADRFAWLMPFAVTVMPAVLALFFAFGMMLAQSCCHYTRARPVIRVIYFALALSLSEWLRGTILTGFPWNLLGYAAAYPLVMMQAASAIGIYGLTLWVGIVATLPLTVLAALSNKSIRSGPAFAAIAGLAAAPVLAGAIYGAIMLAEPAPDMVKGATVRIVQPSIPQIDKFDPNKRLAIFQQHLSLTMGGRNGTARQAAVAKSLDKVTHVIWPEAAMAFLALNSPEALQRISDALPDHVALIAGTLRVHGTYDRSKPQGNAVYNSAIALDGKARLIAAYDKVHLVPFGEYLPFQNTLESLGLEHLTRQRGGFASGKLPRQAMVLPGLPPISMLICYEVIFPGRVVTSGGRAGLLVNITNDAWFGSTTGPYQHFHQARVRAVEQGVPMLRVANNGISGAIDGRGRVLARLALNTRGIVDVKVPAAHPKTFYTRYGELIFAINWALLAAFAFASGRVAKGS